MNLIKNIRNAIGRVSKRFRRSDGAPRPPPDTPPAAQPREASSSGRRGKRDRRNIARRRFPAPSRDFLWHGGRISYVSILMPTALAFVRNVLSTTFPTPLDASAFSDQFLRFLRTTTEVATTEGLAYAVAYLKADRTGTSRDHRPHGQDRATYDHVTLGLINVYQLASNRATKLNLTCPDLPLHLEMNPAHPVFGTSSDKVSAVVRAAISIVETADRAGIDSRVAILAHNPGQYEEFDGRRRFFVLRDLLGSGTPLHRVPGVYSDISFMSHGDFTQRYRHEGYTHAIYLDHPSSSVRYRDLKTITVAVDADAEVELCVSYGYFISMERARQQVIDAAHSAAMIEQEDELANRPEYDMAAGAANLERYRQERIGQEEREARLDAIIEEGLSYEEVIDLAATGDAAAVELLNIQDTADARARREEVAKILATNAGEVLDDGDYEEVWSLEEYEENKTVFSSILLKLMNKETLSPEEEDALERLGQTSVLPAVHEDEVPLPDDEGSLSGDEPAVVPETPGTPHVSSDEEEEGEAFKRGLRERIKKKMMMKKKKKKKKPAQAATTAPIAPEAPAPPVPPPDPITGLVIFVFYSVALCAHVYSFLLDKGYGASAKRMLYPAYCLLHGVYRPVTENMPQAEATMFYILADSFLEYGNLRNGISDFLIQLAYFAWYVDGDGSICGHSGTLFFTIQVALLSRIRGGIRLLSQFWMCSSVLSLRYTYTEMAQGAAAYSSNVTRNAGHFSAKVTAPVVHALCVYSVMKRDQAMALAALLGEAFLLCYPPNSTERWHRVRRAMFAYLSQLNYDHGTLHPQAVLENRMIEIYNRSPEEAMAAVAGIIDSDGCLLVNRRGNERGRVSILIIQSSRPYAYALSSFLSKAFGIHSTITRVPPKGNEREVFTINVRRQEDAFKMVVHIGKHGLSRRIQWMLLLIVLLANKANRPDKKIIARFVCDLLVYVRWYWEPS